MVATAIKEELIEQLDQLPAKMQRRVLEFAHALVLSEPKGASAQDLMSVSGILDRESAREMREAIEEGCERVDADGW